MLHHNAGLFVGTVPVSVWYRPCVCAAMGRLGWRVLRTTSVPLAVCLAVALAGLIGNAIGQAQDAVVAFLGFWPTNGTEWLVMNVADLALVGGVLALGIHLVRRRILVAKPSCLS